MAFRADSSIVDRTTGRRGIEIILINLDPALIARIDLVNDFGDEDR